MNKLLIFLGFFLGITLSVDGQINTPNIVLNHFLVIVDSTTYEAILKSKILNSNFAYAHEKKLNGYKGIYIIGQDNYLEIFSPKSIQNEIHQPGESWICHTSMKVNYLESLNIANRKSLIFSSNEEFDELSLYFKDTTNLFTTWEMNKNHYENWSKKTFNDSVTFLSIDYNSPAESDSARNYLFKNIEGIEISVNKSDSLEIIDYLTLIGYSKSNCKENKLRYANSTDFIEIVFHKENELARITSIYLKLKRKTKSESIRIGNSELFIKGDQARWELEKIKKSKPVG